ncbi:MAG TPA: hypothetical protein VGN12_13975 [Pirellulales bacterium]|jgi:hypothetical protein
MAPENIFKKVWLEQAYEGDTREHLQRAIIARCRSAAQGLIRAFIRGEFQRIVDGLQLVDDFGSDDRSPGVLKIERGFEHGLAARCMFMGGTRLLLTLELPRENHSGLLDFELDLKVGLATVLEDNWHNPDVNSTVLNNRLRFVGEPEAFRLTSNTTATELLKQVTARLKKAVAEAESAVAAA